MAGGVAVARHLSRRFAGALLPGGPGPVDEAWVTAVLSPGERALWGRMSGPDRRHAVGVARRVAAARPDAGDHDEARAVLAAALLHDAGKVESGLGTLARVPATLVGLAGGRVWAGKRVTAYLDHPRHGARLLSAAGAAPLTVAWAAEHHLPPSRWTVPAEIGRVLAAADDD